MAKQKRPFSISKSELDAFRAQAQANANYFQRAYIVFCDTSGQWRMERYAGYHSVPGAEIFHPKGRG